jgi:hypothetical protein
MERLHSQYPAGAVGIALLLLRIISGTWLISDGVSDWISSPAHVAPAIQIAIGVALAALALLLLAGLRTSLAVSIGVVLIVVSDLYSRSPLMAAGQSWFYLFLQLFLCASVALLGPGGYSLDARLSGWKSINISSRED